MDYAFRSSPKKGSIEIQLGGHDMVVMSDKTKYVIPYTEIKEVRLTKKRNIYFATITASQRGSLVIPSQTFTENGNRADQARVYTAFIRVLHIHLLEKSNVNFVTGFSLNKICLWLGLWAILCTLLLFVAKYSDLIQMNQLLMVGIILIAIPILYLMFKQNKWPTSYSPTSIPVTMLPASH